MLKNPVYCGLTVFNRTSHIKKGTHGADRDICRSNPEEKWLTAPGLHAAIITQEQFDQAQSIRIGKDMPQFHLQSGVIRNQFAGILTCAKCGRTLVTSVSAKGGPYIYCRTPDCSAMAKERYVESYLLISLEQELSRMELTDHPDFTDDLAAADRQIAALEQELRKAEAKKPRLYSFLEDGTYTRDIFMERMALTEKEISSITDRLHSARSFRASLESSNPEALKNQLQSVLSLWPESTPAARNNLLKTIISSAEYQKEKKTKPTDFSISLTLRRF
jgi:hypothetical protein